MGVLSRISAYSKLFRLSIAFTPVADVMTGYLTFSSRNDARIIYDIRLVFACMASISVFCFGTSLTIIWTGTRTKIWHRTVHCHRAVFMR